MADHNTPPPSPAANLSHDHHAVPQLYLRGWSQDGQYVMGYRTLVPHDRYPLWQVQGIRSLTVERDLYMAVIDGADSDRFERWMNETIEDPAAEAIERVREDRQLKPEHWRSLARLFGALDLRTISSYVEQKEQWNREIRTLLKEYMQDLPNRVRAWRSEQAAGVGTERPQAHPLPMKVTTEPCEEPGKAIIRAEIIPGRAMWLHTMERQLTTIVSVLMGHRWMILHPADGMEWFTSDHPAVRLNYCDDGHYNFRGGWGRNNGQLLLPLSPRHLMYTKIGTRCQGKLTLSPEMTRKLQRFLAERAHRWIIARQQIHGVAEMRPRRVDLDAFKVEAQALREWRAADLAAADAEPIIITPDPEQKSA